MIEIKENTSLEIENSKFLKKPFGRYLNSGSIGEKIFEEYCKRNDINFIRPLALMWSIYGIFLEEENAYFTHQQKNRVRKYGSEEIMKLLSKKQINFLKTEFVKKSVSNFEITGMPDYVIWKDNNVAMIEIKTRTSFLSKKQEEIIEKLKKHFEVRVYNINFDVKVEKLSVNNIQIKKAVE